MFTHFVCALLGFCAHEFPVKSEKPWTFIVDQRLYIVLCTTLEAGVDKLSDNLKCD